MKAEMRDYMLIEIATNLLHVYVFPLPLILINTICNALNTHNGNFSTLWSVCLQWLHKVKLYKLKKILLWNALAAHQFTTKDDEGVGMKLNSVFNLPRATLMPVLPWLLWWKNISQTKLCNGRKSYLVEAFFNFPVKTKFMEQFSAWNGGKGTRNV